MTDTKHKPPELEAVELNGAWFVRTKPCTPDGTPEIVADLSMARHGREWAALLAASQRMRASLKRLVEVAEPNIYPTPDKPKSAWAALEDARTALAATEGRTEDKDD